MQERTTAFSDDLQWNLRIAYDLINFRVELKSQQL